MKSWRVRLLALLTVVAMLLAVSGPAAMAQTFCNGNGCFNTTNDNCSAFGDCGGFNNGFFAPVDNSSCGFDEFGNSIGCGGGFCGGFGTGDVAEEALAVALC